MRRVGRNFGAECSLQFNIMVNRREVFENTVVYNWLVGIKSGICRKISRFILIINKVIYKLNIIMQLKHGKYCNGRY